MFYPPIKPFHQEWLPVSDGHEIYIEQSGSLEGIPIIYLHGGPGGGSSALYRSLFDPAKYRIILFDQRGCGQSRPYLSTQANTTHDLINDIEAIRQHLAIDKWFVTGGSWGTTLALLYAQAFAERVKGMILRSVFLARQQDIEWLYYPNGGAACLFPDQYQHFNRLVKVDENPIEAYWPKLSSHNELEQLNAARQWALWEYRISRINFNANNEADLAEKQNCLPMALLECHYFRHQSFIEENQILLNMDKIAHIPATIIHGRYDAVCDLKQAWSLHQVWSNSHLQIIPEAGHSVAEPGIAKAFCRASKAFIDIA
ncbi:prolyl aminopeptidase [Algibacillus agarilyticus]|uniref:prolyl aminopeptidase n=1 Tax=Algibacillus agarilyticus TaxID=2234133 RepID=UPI000DD0B6A8|nr:prolyl aminopeptidase [Algibacillus agarilyticus]